MSKKEEIKLCLDELGHLLQMLATMEEKEYPVVINRGKSDEKEKMSSYKETVQDLADIAAVQFLDQLYGLLDIEID